MNHGLTYVVSAGNQNTDACTRRPAAATEAITVGAVSQSMRRWVSGAENGSNWGCCVDLFAPGHNITAAGPGGDQATTSKTGTSMAAPLVAGVAAMYLARNPTASAAEVHSAAVGTSTPNVVGNAVAGRRTGCCTRIRCRDPAPP